MSSPDLYALVLLLGRSSFHLRVLLLAFLTTFAWAHSAHADPGTASGPTATASAAVAPRAHSIYVELLGKGGLWGLGYDYQFHPRLAAGATASFFILDGERVLSLSPYLVGYLLGTGHHRWFAQIGPQLSYVYTPSPVPEWPGTSTGGIGAELSSGYEYRSRVLVRVFGMGIVGRGGYAPWFGVSLGWTL